MYGVGRQLGPSTFWIIRPRRCHGNTKEHETLDFFLGGGPGRGIPLPPPPDPFPPTPVGEEKEQHHNGDNLCVVRTQMEQT